ncbi:hypothetical protein, partial [Serratia marcescens]|uniref:hypothetical protein n=1 Tax=Serratia marcescens TaxID=615 RepID=UPI001952EC6B
PARHSHDRWRAEGIVPGASPHSAFAIEEEARDGEPEFDIFRVKGFSHGYRNEVRNIAEATICPTVSVSGHD